MTLDEIKYLMEAFENVKKRDRIIECNTIDRVLDTLDKKIYFYKKLGKQDSEHREVLNALMDFRRSIVKLKEEGSK